jgi:D-3-phosphoglycerate dehydrogenase
MFQRVGGRLRAEGCEVACINDPTEIEDQLSLVRDADVLVIGSNFRCDRTTLQAGRKLRAVIYGATGTDGIDLPAANELGIVVGHAPTAENYRSMAEATILLILALFYDLHGAEDILRRNLPRTTHAMRARAVSGRTVGLLGFGRVARVVAENLSSWGVNLQAYIRSPDKACVPEHVMRVSLDELLATSDVVSIHTSRSARDPALIGERELGLMKASAFLVNTARGGIVDESALIRALREGRIAGAALDTFEVEPLPPDSPFRTMDNVILTPHVIGHTQDTMVSLEEALIENIDNVLKGMPPRYVRNPEVLSRWTANGGYGMQAARSRTSPTVCQTDT